MSTIGGAIEALKNNGIHFTIVDNAEVHDGSHGFVCLLVVSYCWRAESADNVVCRPHVPHNSNKAGAGAGFFARAVMVLMK